MHTGGGNRVGQPLAHIPPELIVREGDVENTLDERIQRAVARVERVVHPDAIREALGGQVCQLVQNAGGIECALDDIKGEVLGDRVCVCELLGKLERQEIGGQRRVGPSLCKRPTHKRARPHTVTEPLSRSQPCNIHHSRHVAHQLVLAGGIQLRAKAELNV